MGGNILERKSGVPQESVLGPLLWNIAFDGILRMPTPANCEIICYADHTLVIAGGEDIEKAIERAEVLVNIIILQLQEQ